MLSIILAACGAYIGVSILTAMISYTIQSSTLNNLYKKMYSIIDENKEDDEKLLKVVKNYYEMTSSDISIKEGYNLYSAHFMIGLIWPAIPPLMVISYIIS